MGGLKLIGAGFALLGLLLVLAPRLAAARPQPIAYAIRLFLPLWLLISAAALLVSLRRGGATLAQEAWLVAPAFGLPAAAALLILYATGSRR